MQNTSLTVGIFTLGCKVNQYESEAIAERFSANGFRVLPSGEQCDIYVINTCTVTAESDRKTRQTVRRAIHQNPNAYILVTGCLAQTDPEQLSAIAGVDYICGNADKLSVVQAARELAEKGRKNAMPVLIRALPDAGGFEKMCIRHFDRTRAYVKIEDGCESHCTYCIIPSARGRIRSKKPDEVLDEVRMLTQNGCREVVLTGIETASYGKDLPDCDLAELLCRIDRISDIGRVRLGSLDPSLIRPNFVNRIAGLTSLAPHFHLSLQSGSDSVLARMKRKYNSRMALDGMRLLRQAIPEVQFTTDIIVGFPQETEAEFEETLHFIEQAEFLMIHAFPYSKRSGTPAAQMDGQLPEEVKHERVRRLSRRQAEIRSRLLSRMTGKTVPVLFESWENGNAYGHTPQFIEVACPSASPLHAQLLHVHILGNNGSLCTGELQEKPQK